MEVLSENSIIKVNGKYKECKAVLLNISGGKQVVYLDRDGNEVRREALCRSQFAETVKNHDKVAEQATKSRFERWCELYDDSFDITFSDVLYHLLDEGMDIEEAKVIAVSTARKAASELADREVNNTNGCNT